MQSFTQTELQRMPSADNTIGVIGGGQLALMLGEAAQTRGLTLAVQASKAEDPAASLAKDLVIAGSTDARATRELSTHCLGITFENEWIAVDALMPLERQGVQFTPSLASLVPLVNKLSQRRLLDDLLIPSPDWISLAELNPGSPSLPNGWTFPVMAKAAYGGYVGKGTRVVEDLNGLAQLLRNVDANEWLIEAWVSYEQELALVVSRDAKGRIRSLPLAETHQKNQVCDWVIAPASVRQIVESTAYQIAASLLTKLSYVGVMSLEFFYGSEGLFVNEIAPRTHNSGHFSIEACSSSQFDQQLCIAAGLDVPNPEFIADGSLMVNLLGLGADQAEPLEERLSKLRSIEGLHLHWYGKHEIPGRKVGHITTLLNGRTADERAEQGQQMLQRVREIWPLPLNWS